MELNWTGERLVTSLKDEIVIEHLHRYKFAESYCHNKVVLDIACGEGYGVKLLSKISKNITGIDIDEKTINHASKKYVSANITFKTGSVYNIPLADSSIDVIVSFETIEHIDNHENLMIEFKRVLNQNGTLIISTPEKKNYSDNREHKNEFHLKELYFNEFYALAKKYFNHCNCYIQSNEYSSVISPISLPTNNIEYYTGNFENIAIKKEREAMYNILVCSNTEINNSQTTSLFSLYNVNEKINEVKKDIYNSKTYRVGKILLNPIIFLKKIFK